MGPLMAAIVSLIFIFSAVAARAQEPNLCEREMAQAASKYRVPLGILYAVAQAETGAGGSLHAYALNLEGTALYSLDRTQAIERFKAAKAAGMKLIDVGCMQLNHYFHGDRFASVEDMFDPHRNVDYAARFLSELKAREGSWTMAVARYNAGKNNDPAQKRYVCRVLDRLVKSGFGAWTASSTAFCEGELKATAAASKTAGDGRSNSLAQVH
jgi:soluble lytic murein transglycosylase-like protein